MGEYDDLLYLPHPVSRKHPPMSAMDRAAQFSPFSALTGYEAVLQEAGRLTDSRAELTEYSFAYSGNYLFHKSLMSWARERSQAPRPRRRS